MRIPFGPYCDEKTAKMTPNEWEGRRFDLKAMFLPQEMTTDELLHFLDYENIEIPDKEDYPFFDEDYGFDEDAWRDELEKSTWKAWQYYGLGIYDVPPCSYPLNPERWIAIIFSTGGPGDELRFYYDCGSRTYKRAEYWYLPQGKGCGLDVSGDEVVDEVWEYLTEVMYDKILNCEDTCGDYIRYCDPSVVPEDCKETGEW